MLAPATSLTIEDFEQLPHEETCDKELVGGELLEVSGSTYIHNRLRARIESLMAIWLASHSVGEFLAEQEYDFGGNVHAPDISFSRLQKLALAENSKRVQRFVPDLAIEIASPGDSYSALMKKLRRYRDSGVEEVWLFEPETREARVYSATRNLILFEEGLFDPSPLQGFSVPLLALYNAVS